MISCCSLSHVWLFATPWTAARQASLSFAISQSLLKLRFIESVMPSNHFILCRPLFLLPSVFPSIRVFSDESALHIRWPKYWSFNFSISPSNESSELIFFRIDWFDLFAVQGTLKSLLQHHSSKASIFNENRFQQKPCASYRILIVASWLIYSGIAWCGGLVAKSKLVASLLLFPWDFPGKNTGVGYHFLQGIFPTQGLKAGLLHCRQTLYQLSYQGIPPNQWTCTKL